MALLGEFSLSQEQNVQIADFNVAIKLIGKSGFDGDPLISQM